MHSLRNKTPTNECDEKNPYKCYGTTNRTEIQHAEWFWCKLININFLRY